MSLTDTVVTSKTVDLTNCDREQIQYAGAIQPHGVMLVLQEPDLRILQASQNTGELLGIAVENLVNHPLQAVFSEENITKLRSRFVQDKLDGPPVHVARTEVAGREFDVLAHRSDHVLVLELEERPKSVGTSVLDLYSELHEAISKLETATSLQAFLDLAAQQIRAFTCFDRVMVYKFMEDNSGWVRSEALGEGFEPYLGLHYPASDIPVPARRLFSLTWVRHQPDIEYSPVPIFPENNPLTDKPLDMSYAFLRSVSIMYVDYLKNMGTRSSLVMTLLKNGSLWGLVACHHHTGPKHVPFEVRVACELLAHMVSLLMSAKEDLENQEYRIKLKSHLPLIVENVSRRGDFVSGFFQETPSLLDFVKADGAAMSVNGSVTSTGLVPSRAEIAHIVTWLSTAMQEQVFSTDCLSAHLPDAAAFRGTCAGLLALRFSNSNSDFILWFRPEIIQTVNWAGDPQKPMIIGETEGTLHPRNSFELWKETVHLKSSPWSSVECEAANELRVALLELVLRRAEELGGLYADLERSHAELDSFAYVASHDLKEPLRGIHNYAEMLRVDYAGKLDKEGDAKLATLSRLSTRMDQLLSALLDYSRVGRSEFSNSQVDLNQIVSEALDTLDLRIRTAGVVIRIPRPLPSFKGDHFRLLEVFTNLLSNAIKYNDKPVKEIEIGFEESTVGDQPVMYIRDNGIGIQERHHEQIFEIFRRLHAQAEFGGGAGAGLSIAGKIINRIGGRIWLKSIPGEGTTFYFTLGKTTAAGAQRQ